MSDAPTDQRLVQGMSSVQYRPGGVRLRFAVPEGAQPILDGQPVESFDVPMTAEEALTLAADIKSAAEAAIEARRRAH